MEYIREWNAVSRVHTRMKCCQTYENEMLSDMREWNAVSMYSISPPYLCLTAFHSRMCSMWRRYRVHTRMKCCQSSTSLDMEWLRLVGYLTKIDAAYAAGSWCRGLRHRSHSTWSYRSLLQKSPIKDYFLQKRPIILSSLLIVATPYQVRWRTDSISFSPIIWFAPILLFISYLTHSYIHT